MSFEKKQRKDPVADYSLALDIDASLDDDPRLVANLVGALGWVGEPAFELLVAHMTSEAPCPYPLVVPARM